MDNKKEELWNKFYMSGRIEDYLDYRKSVAEAENKNVTEYTGAGDPGTDGERK